MKKNLMKTFQRILSCITVITLIVGIMAGGAFAKYEDYTLEELIKKAISLSESERLDLLNELTQQDLDFYNFSIALVVFHKRYFHKYLI
jgi:large-conductance mechanosensitive channel